MDKAKSECIHDPEQNANQNAEDMKETQPNTCCPMPGQSLPLYSNISEIESKNKSTTEGMPLFIKPSYSAQRPLIAQAQNNLTDITNVPECSHKQSKCLDQEPTIEHGNSLQINPMATSKLLNLSDLTRDIQKTVCNTATITPIIIAPSYQSPMIVPPRNDIGNYRDVAECSHNQNINRDPKTEVEKTPSQAVTPKSFILSSPLTELAKEIRSKLIIRSSIQGPITVQPRSNLQSPISVVLPGFPPSLFLQALNKLNESSNFPALDKLESLLSKYQNATDLEEGEITPPDSLTSAPPSYSFVLRQMAARRRPRLMGTFIPSPSFVQHTPPPTYATAFDIYVDNRLSRPPQRVFNDFGFTSMPAVCPECGYTGMTLSVSKITLCTHMCAFILCLFCCWICAPMPYFLRSCKDVYHYCRNCRTLLGLYCPTNPEANFT